MFRVFMLLRHMLEGRPVREAAASVRRDLWPVMKTDYRIWPIYDVLCFTVIPRHVQAVSTGLLGVVWAAYLSVIVHQPLHPSPAIESTAAAA
jgi:hypothetical protein